MKSDLILILFPALIWVFAIEGRPWVMKRHCAQYPDQCKPEKIFLPDRVTMRHENQKADDLSTQAEISAGLIAFATPLVWHLSSIFLKSTALPVALTLTLSDLIPLTQSIMWNGMIKELTHWLVQRPRPFVYSAPEQFGTDPAHYTSFYSGHTSFVTVVAISLLFFFMRHPIPHWFMFSTTGAMLFLLSMTAIGRVLAGRHFLTDVLGAILLGAVVTIALHFQRFQRS